ncbi:MAG: hypothetical protein FD167_3289, partial [bacterium]
DQTSDYVIVDEKITDYYDLLAWSQLTKSLPEDQIQELLESQQHENENKNKAIVKQAVDLREAIYRICKQIISKKEPNPLDIGILNQTLSIAYSHGELVFIEGKFLWQWSKNSLDKILWLIADSAAEFLTTTDLSRLHECGGVGCSWLFEDSSKNKMRQWCDMQTCGNLAKVRRFRSKSKEKTQQ